jgi:hypothetical protein
VLLQLYEIDPDYMTFPETLLFSSDKPLSKQQIEFLEQSSPTSRAESDITIPGYDPVEDQFDESIWHTINWDNTPSLCLENLRVIVAWL